MNTVNITKLNAKGQGLAYSKALNMQLRVWNALPGESVSVELLRRKKKYREAVAKEIENPNKNRIEPREELVQMLTTSPLQHMDINFELSYKTEVQSELFRQALDLKQYSFTEPIAHIEGNEYGYRNKMEYSFYGDESGIHAAFYARGGGKGKFIVKESALASENSNKALLFIIQKINLLKELEARDLKSVIIRSNGKDEVIFAVYAKKEIELDLSDTPEFIKGAAIYFSDPKSPVAKPTKLIQKSGELSLSESIGELDLKYGLNSFFQVNVPVFELALADIKQFCKSGLVIDFYSGVGSIGLSLADKDNHVVLVEENAEASSFAKENATQNNLSGVDIFTNQSENLTEFIAPKRIIIFDPPREGLHKNVIKRILSELPEKIIYLSCNSETQAANITELKENYKIIFHRLYNFFPRTPHVESLVVLEKK